MLQQLSDAELEIMKIIWEKEGPSLFAFLMDELAKRGKTWQKNTLITLLSRLMDKKYLTAKKTGRCNQYTPLVTETEYQLAQTKIFLNRVYEGEAKGLISTLIQGDLLTDEEYGQLQKLLEGGKPD